MKKLALYFFAFLGLFSQGLVAGKPKSGHDPLLQAIANQAHPCLDDSRHMRELRTELVVQLRQGAVLQGALYDYLRTEEDFLQRLSSLAVALKVLDELAEKSPQKLSQDAVDFRANGEAEFKALIAVARQAIEDFRPKLEDAWQNAFGQQMPKEPLRIPEFHRRKPQLRTRYSYSH